MLIVKGILFLSALIYALDYPTYALTSRQIKEICKREVNFAKCIKDIKAIDRNRLNYKEKKLFTPIQIKVIPYNPNN